MGLYKAYSNKAISYFKKHPIYHVTIHAIGGIGIGILITHPFIDPHPVRWGLALGVLAILGHLFALVA